MNHLWLNESIVTKMSDATHSSHTRNYVTPVLDHSMTRVRDHCTMRGSWKIGDLSSWWWNDSSFMRTEWPELVKLGTATLCNTLQHTETHCNTLQHAATHCDTLQHTATLCNTRQHSATHCNTLQHTATHCNTLQHAATHCNTLQHTATLCNTLQLHSTF